MKQNNNFTNILLLGGTGIITGLINYAYHPLMLQFLTLEEFGEFASLLGVVNILGIFLVGISLFLNKEVSSLGENPKKIALLFGESMKYMLGLGVLLGSIYIILSPFLARFLHLERGLVLLAGVTLVMSCMGSVNDGVLRGLRQFRFLSGLSIFSALVKLCLGLTLVSLSFGNYGALAGVVLSGIVSFAVCIFWILTLLSHAEKKQKNLSERALWKDFLEQRKEIGNFILVSFFFAFFFNIDVIFAKHLFAEDIVGIYAGISILGKFLVFLLLSIETVYYSEIMSQTKDTVQKHHIINPLIAIGLLSVFALAINFFIGDYLLFILKPELAGNTNLYLLLLVYYSFLVGISFFSKILVGWGYYFINILLGIFALILIFLTFTFGKYDILLFIEIFIGVGASLCIILGIIFWKIYSHNTKKKIL